MRSVTGRAAESTTSRPTIYSRVVDELGVAVCGGALPAGSVIRMEEIEESTGASRSVVRESTRVLAHLGLLDPRKRVGMVVLPESEWNLFDPQVIRWRLDSPRRDDQVRELTQIRLAIEPQAARLAAEHATAEQTGAIMSAAATLWATGVDGDRQTFARDDALFHRLVLEASGNSMFAKLAGVISEALLERALVQLHEKPVDLTDMQLHVDLAGHIQRGEGQKARECAQEIIERAAGD